MSGKIRKSRSLSKAASLAFCYSCNALFLKKGDVLLCSYPKSGNTWVRILYYHYLAQVLGKNADFSFSQLDGSLPELGRVTLFERWGYPGYPRVIKTHRPYASWMGRARKILVVRDPGDVMVSYFNYTRNLNTFAVDGSLSDFVRDPRFGIPAWMEYHRRWMPHVDLLVSYEALKKDTESTLAALLEALDISINEKAVSSAVEASSLERVRKAEESSGHSRPHEIKEGFLFARDGRVGQAKSLLSDDDAQFISDCWQRHPELRDLAARLGWQ